MSELLKRDSDIGPILRIRIQQTEQLNPRKYSESEAVKALWGKWHCLVL